METPLSGQEVSRAAAQCLSVCHKLLSSMKPSGHLRSNDVGWGTRLRSHISRFSPAGPFFFLPVPSVALACLKFGMLFLPCAPEVTPHQNQCLADFAFPVLLVNGIGELLLQPWSSTLPTHHPRAEWGCLRIGVCLLQEVKRQEKHLCTGSRKAQESTYG